MSECRVSDWRSLIPQPPAPGGSYRVPPWMDAGYMLAAGNLRVSLVTCVPLGSPPNVPGDTTRWGIGFLLGPGPAPPGGVFVAPWNTREFGTFPFVLGSISLQFNVFNHGPMPAMEWYVAADTGEQITMFELLIN